MRNYENRRKFLFSASAAAAMFCSSNFAASAVLPSVQRSPWLDSHGRLKIGLLWSLTGNLSMIEKSLRDVVLFWIDSVNRDGGVAGLKIEPIIIDTKSDIKAYREGALHLTNNEKVLAIFGGYTSASRRAIMPLIELHGGLLFYPAFYFGRECWQGIVCTGPVPNQHSLDLIPFMCRRYGTRVYFVGTNNIGPKESNRNAKKWLDNFGGSVVGEAYLPMGYEDFTGVLSDIRRKNPDWIFSTIIGDSDIAFRREYVKAGMSPDKLPTASLTTSEMEVKIVGHAYGEGHIVSAPYFQSLDSECNQQFVGAFLDSPHGTSGVTHYTMEETYLSCLYFKKSVENIVVSEGVSALSPKKVRDRCGGLELSPDESPEGAVSIDPRNFNSWLTPMIGRFNSLGQVDVLAQSARQVPPLPYKLYPERGECNADGLHLPTGQIVKSAS